MGSSGRRTRRTGCFELLSCAFLISLPPPTCPAPVWDLGTASSALVQFAAVRNTVGGLRLENGLTRETDDEGQRDKLAARVTPGYEIWRRWSRRRARCGRLRRGYPWRWHLAVLMMSLPVCVG